MTKQGKLSGMGKATELEKSADKYVAEYEKSKDQQESLNRAESFLMEEMEKIAKRTLEVKDSTGATLRIRISVTSSKKLKVKRL